MKLTSELWLRHPVERVFPFFADAANLERLTPPWLHFRILTPAPIVMHEGTRIDYRIRLHGIPLGWQSEITAWDPPHRFVDEQRRGPYTYWRHAHTFVEERGGTLVKDDVEFDVPFAFVSRWFVMRDLRKVFDYRSQAMLKLFPPSA
ncbi:MAG: SRPBCC family protein [Betaproteobacteria bacterium]